MAVCKIVILVVLALGCLVEWSEANVLPEELHALEDIANIEEITALVQNANLIRNKRGYRNPGTCDWFGRTILINGDREANCRYACRIDGCGSGTCNWSKCRCFNCWHGFNVFSFPYNLLFALYFLCNVKFLRAIHVANDNRFASFTYVISFWAFLNLSTANLHIEPHLTSIFSCRTIFWLKLYIYLTHSLQLFCRKLKMFHLNVLVVTCCWKLSVSLVTWHHLFPFRVFSTLLFSILMFVQSSSPWGKSRSSS